MVDHALQAWTICVADEVDGRNIEINHLQKQLQEARSRNTMSLSPPNDSHRQSLNYVPFKPKLGEIARQSSKLAEEVMAIHFRPQSNQSHSQPQHKSNPELIVDSQLHLGSKDLREQSRVNWPTTIDHSDQNGSNSQLDSVSTHPDSFVKGSDNEKGIKSLGLEMDTNLYIGMLEQEIKRKVKFSIRLFFFFFFSFSFFFWVEKVSL